MAGDALKWLEDWYASRCDGLLEHGYGIKIGTLDNPGWTLKVNITGTNVENTPFEEVRHNYDDEVSWWVCWRDEREFHAACGVRELHSVIGVFRAWVEANQPTDPRTPSVT